MLTKIKRLEYLDFEIVDKSRIKKKNCKKKKDKCNFTIKFYRYKKNS